MLALSYTSVFFKIEPQYCWDKCCNMSLFRPNKFSDVPVKKSFGYFRVSSAHFRYKERQIFLTDN